MANPAELPRGNGRLHQGGIPRLSATAPAHVQHDGDQENTSINNFASDSFKSQNFVTPYSLGDIFGVEFQFKVRMNSRPEPPTRTKFIKNGLKPFAI